MEDLLQQYDAESRELWKWDECLSDDVTQALQRFVEVLEEALPLLQQGREDEKSHVSVEWLIDLCGKIPSELGTTTLAREIVEASHLADTGRQQEALFAILGASEIAMEVLFELAPLLHQIKETITLDQIGSSTGDSQGRTPDLIDEEEINRQNLRRDALDAAQVAAIAQAEAGASQDSSRSGSTHTITRTSEIQAQKVAKKAAKRAAQAMERARAAGAILDEGELLSVQQSTFGHGGLMGQSDEALRVLQESLQPEGSRQHYGNQGLPDGTIREDDDVIGYERVTIPPPHLDKSKLHPRLMIEDIFDDDLARAFAGTSSLNPMQSTVFDTAFNRRENMLICAPTGAGKTNVAMLTVAAHFRDVGLIGESEESDNLETGAKVVYIAPMKALAQEVVEKFSSKLKCLGLIVRELTGDMQLTRAEAQACDMIVTTPEKWDLVTRKSGNDPTSLGNQCGLLVIDEVHLLADDRGAVIESVVSRLHRLVETRQVQVRIVGLSATLPNYEDVAEFLQVPSRGLFYFGPEHRPVPLQQTFIGVTGNVKNRQLMEDKMDDVCYETVKDSLMRGCQVMVFVHSRKGTSDAAAALAKRASEAGELDRYFVTQGVDGSPGNAYKKYVDRARKSRNREVTNHFYNGMGIHHAGMLRSDRKLSELMFADGAIKVLCCTATLAWGVNLPARAVVIKGTDVYNPEKGKRVDLGILDVQQIFGRAGRPQFDTSGEATLITNHAALTRYLDKLVRAVPIESTFIKQLADHLNAEVVGGTVTNIDEAASWLQYTYLYTRMMKNPRAYGITADQKEDDPALRGRCRELVEEAASYLAQNRMINYHKESGNISMNTLGRVAAHFYIQSDSVIVVNSTLDLKSSPTDVELLRMITSASEFENLRVRQEEQNELDSMKEKCPLKLSAPVNDAATKAFVLMQAYISKTRPKSFTLISDMNYIASNAGRVARAIFEMCLHTNKGGTALKVLRLAKSVEHQFWWFQSPLRHFESDIGLNVVKKLEAKLGNSRTGYDTLQTTLSLLDMRPEEVGQLFNAKKNDGYKMKALVNTIPVVDIRCRVLPVTADVLRFKIEIEPTFRWNGKWHGNSISFWLWIEDTKSAKIYHHESVTLSKRTFPETVELNIPVPAFQSTPQYLVRVVSTAWVGVESVCPVSMTGTMMLKHSPMYTDLIDLTPLPTTALQDERYEQLFTNIETFNPVQSQLFHVLYHQDSPLLLGAPTGSGKTLVAELALLRMKKKHPKGICVYIAPLKSLARERLKEWQRRFGGPPMKWNILELSGDTSHDRRVVERADVLVCTPEKWDLISRSWKAKQQSCKSGETSFILRVRLLVIDEIHLLGEERGAVLEAIVSRTRFMSQNLTPKEDGVEQDSLPNTEAVRIVGLSTALANPTDLADWIGINTTGNASISRRGLYNFRPSIRPVPTKVHVQGYSGKHYCPRMATMNKPCYAAIKQHSPDRPSLIFVASRRQTRLTAFDIITHAAADDVPRRFLGCDEAVVEAIAESIRDDALRHCITFGIGLHHAGLNVHDRDIVEGMYLRGDIRVLVATATLAWGVNLPARLVIVKGTEYFDGKTSRYVDYPLTDVLQMIGRAGRPGFDTEGRAVVMVEESKKLFYKKFLYTPLPVESCLLQRICENLNAEVASRTINSVVDAVGYLTWTFFARRVKVNPSYYGAQSSSDEDVQDLLLTVVRDTVEKLQDSGCVVLEETDDACETLSPTLLGAACADFYLTFRTPNQMLTGLRRCAAMMIEERNNTAVDSVPAHVSKETLCPLFRPKRLDEVGIAWLLYTVACTHEFDELPVRHNEEQLNEELSSNLMWGHDTSSITESNENRYINPEVYEDPHTKCFLLIQAYLEHAELPISDYVNDTKSVTDNIPRLLAAMLSIALKDSESSDGCFDLVCQLYRTSQLFNCRATLNTDPLSQLHGLRKHAISLLREKLGNDPLWNLRQLSRDAASSEVKIPKGKLGIPVHSLLDSLYALPLAQVEEVALSHFVDKTTGTSRGKLTLTLQLHRKEGNKGRNKGREKKYTLAVVLGTLETQRLLGSCEVPMFRTGQWTVHQEITFDWSTANAGGGEGGGFVVLRLLHDSVRGLDSEMLVALQSSSS